MAKFKGIQRPYRPEGLFRIALATFGFKRKLHQASSTLVLRVQEVTIYRNCHPGRIPCPVRSQESELRPELPDGSQRHASGTTAEMLLRHRLRLLQKQKSESLVS